METGHGRTRRTGTPGTAEMSGFLLVVLLLITPFLWSKLGSLQRQVDELKTEVEGLRYGSSGDTHRFTVNSTSSAQDAVSFSPSSDSSMMSHPTMDRELEQELLTMVRSGNKIKAIKTLREARGLSLKEAKDQVDALDK